MAEMDLPDIDLEGRVVIMTGADRGLGRAMSLGLAKKGARLVLASPVMAGLNAVAEEIAAIAGPGRARAVETDITDLDSCANCLRAAVDAFGVLHVLVNNARRLRRDADKPEAAGHLPFWAVDPVLYRETVEVNVAGTFFMSRTVTPYFIEMGYGKIINLTTSLRNFYSVGQSPYGVTKAAIDSSTYIWARDLEGKGVTVNALLPGGACDNGDVNRPPEPGHAAPRRYHEPASGVDVLGPLGRRDRHALRRRAVGQFPRPGPSRRRLPGGRLDPRRRGAGF